MKKTPVYVIKSHNTDRDYPIYNILTEDTYLWIQTGSKPSEATMEAAFHSSDFFCDFKKATKTKTYDEEFRKFFNQETKNYTYEQRLQTFEVSDVTFNETDVWDSEDVKVFATTHNLEVIKEIDFYEQ